MHVGARACILHLQQVGKKELREVLNVGADIRDNPPLRFVLECRFVSGR